MGLGFYNEILMAAEQIYPSANDAKRDRNAVEGVRVPNLYNAQGFMALPFVLDMGVSAPPSLRLLPCRPYSGAAIGWSVNKNMLPVSSYSISTFSFLAQERLTRSNCSPR